MNLRERILATRAEAERRLSLAEAAASLPWYDPDPARSPAGAHIAANDPTTIAAEQRRIIAACDADLALLRYMDSDGANNYALWGAGLDNLTTRYPEVEA